MSEHRHHPSAPAAREPDRDDAAGDHCAGSLRARGGRAAAVAAALALTALLPAAGAWAASGSRPAGAITGTRASLTAVAAIPGTSDAWAVGQTCPKAPEGCTPGRDIVLHESSSRWSVGPAPSPGGQASLAAVSAGSRSDAWAVGSYDGGEKNLYLHWTGHAWAKASGPTPDGSVLTGVAVISPADVLAVGYYTSRSGTPVTLSLHWNGRTWAKVATPDPGSGDNELSAITAAPGGTAWAVGDYLDPQARTKTLILHWNGSAWSQASAPAIPTFATRLSGVTDSGPDAWAVGQYYSAAETNQPLILRWNGSTWSRATLPRAGSKTETLSAVSASSPSNAWAVGPGPCVGPSINCPSKTLTMHWDGSAWKVISSVSISAHQDQNSLAGVLTTSASDAWAVGEYFPAAESEPIYAMLQHWNGSRWTTG